MRPTRQDHAVLVPGGKMLLTMGGSGWARMWDLESGEVLWTDDTFQSVAAALQRQSKGPRFSPDGASFLIPGPQFGPASTSFWDARTGRKQTTPCRFEETRTLELKSNEPPPTVIGLQEQSSRIQFSAAAFSPDGGRVLTWQGHLSVTTDQKNFYYKYTRELLKNGAQVKQKTWEKTIPRDHQ